MDKLEAPLLSGNTNLRKSNWELLKARAMQNDTNVSAEPTNRQGIAQSLVSSAIAESSFL